MALFKREKEEFLEKDGLKKRENAENVALNKKELEKNQKNFQEEIKNKENEKVIEFFSLYFIRNLTFKKKREN